MRANEAGFDASALRDRIRDERVRPPRTAGNSREQKPHVFVAMPITEETADMFHYGIRGAVKTTGYLCERIDQDLSTGDVLTQIKERIQTAKLVIAVLTGANPNVYLEVGYAWGCGIPTVLLIDRNQVSGLWFDVAAQRCVPYSSIQDLEEKLVPALEALIDHLGPRR